MALLREGCHWEVGFKVSKLAHTSPSVCLSSCPSLSPSLSLSLLTDKDVSFQLLSQCQAVCHHAVTVMILDANPLEL